MAVDAVIVAAGSSSRFGAGDKLLAELGGMPVVGRTLATFLACEAIGGVVLVASERNADALRAIAAAHGDRVRVILGGARRRDSVEAGVRACDSDYVAIHDGARPLVTQELIARVIAEAKAGDGAIAAMPVTDTIKEVADGVITGSPDRARLWAAQTPQVVRREDWLRAAALDQSDETDDAAMVARLGLRVTVVEGSAANMKVTRASDLVIAERLLAGMDGA